MPPVRLIARVLRVREVDLPSAPHVRSDQAFASRADDRSGADSQHALFDPSAWTYRPANAGTYTDEGMGPDGRRSSRRFHADRSICVRCGRSCSASHKALAPTSCAPSMALRALLVLTGSTGSAKPL